MAGRRAMACLFVLATSVAYPGQSAAQIVVEGEALDALTGMPVRGVIVQLPNLGIATLSDSMGYFRFDAVPEGTQIISTYHMGYQVLAAETPILSGELLVLNLTPQPIAVRGVDVDVASRTEREILTQGRSSDFIDEEAVAEAAGRTNKLLEVMRAKAPPRLQISQEGGPGGVKFCIQNTRRRPSVQETIDIGTGCRPSLLVMDGVVVYAPPSSGQRAPPDLPSDVAWMILNQNPDEIESIRILTSSDAFFRYGEDGRLGAVEIVTKRPERIRR